MESKVITQAGIDRTKAKEKSKPPPIDLTLASSSSNAGGKTSPSPHLLSARGDKEKKIGHRRVDEAGQVTYKKKPTSELMAAMQLGISRSIGSLSMKPERDLLMQDFTVVESVFFPSEGSNITPAHHYSDFRFKTYAPTAFRYFRLLFGIQPDDFLMSLCNEPLRELSNPGASGSVFYITNDDEFIIKTVQHKEAEFLQKLLPGYYMNLNQNPRTLLPKFYGLYCYQCGGKNIRFIIMNNLLPTNIRLHEKYDLKGSTHKRKASKAERAKRSPTLKDLDFMSNHPEGVLLESETWAALCKTIQRDCRVLESFKIMDYSLLLGIHNLDQAAVDKRLAERESRDSHSSQQDTSIFNTSLEMTSDKGLQRNKSVKQRLANYSTALESIQADSEPVEVDDENTPPGGIPARNTKGERLLLFIGIIDILQSYRLSKKLEHTIKAVVHEGDTISVHRPGFYAQRYVAFFNDRIFKKVPCLDQPSLLGVHAKFRKLAHLALKHSPSKKKATQRQRSVTQDSEVRLDRQRSREDDTLAGPSSGGRPDLLPTTPDVPVTGRGDESRNTGTQVTDDQLNRSHHTPELLRPLSYKSAVQERIYQEETSKSPNHSLSESTTAYTEEPSVSYTASSPSVSCESLERDAMSAKAHSPSLDDLPEASSSQEHIDRTSDSYGSQASVDNDNSIVSPEDVTLSDITLKPEVSCESVPSTMTLTPDNSGEVTRDDHSHGASAEGTLAGDQVQN